VYSTASNTKLKYSSWEHDWTSFNHKTRSLPSKNMIVCSKKSVTLRSLSRNQSRKQKRTWMRLGALYSSLINPNICYVLNSWSLQSRSPPKGSSGLSSFTLCKSDSGLDCSKSLRLHTEYKLRFTKAKRIAVCIDVNASYSPQQPTGQVDLNSCWLQVWGKAFLMGWYDDMALHLYNSLFHRLVEVRLD